MFNNLFKISIIICLNFLILSARAQDKIPTEEQYFETIRNEGVSKGVELFHQLRQTDPDLQIFSEIAMNQLGYEFLSANKIEEATELFKLNVIAYPDAWNTYDSLGEAYMIQGNTELAIKNYTKSVELNSNNQNGKGIAKVLANYNKQEHMIPMRDGVKLFTQVYIPKNKQEEYPFLLFRTPYSVGNYGTKNYRGVLGPNALYADEEYIFVYQDVRGKFNSEGEFIVMKPHITNKQNSQDTDESSDTYDTIEWLLRNIPNHNGRVGQWGISYPGFQTVMGMIDAHPAMKASSPQASPADMWIGDDFHHNGAFRLMYTFQILRKHILKHIHFV